MAQIRAINGAQDGPLPRGPDNEVLAINGAQNGPLPRGPDNEVWAMNDAQNSPPGFLLYFNQSLLDIKCRGYAQCPPALGT